MKRSLPTLAVLLLAFSPLAAAEAVNSEEPSAEQATQDVTDPGAAGLVEKVRVTASRLPDATEEASRVPAHVTVYTREEIRVSGAATLQGFLAMRSDFVVFDEVGKGLESTADLRGFNTGSLATSALVVPRWSAASTSRMRS